MVREATKKCNFYLMARPLRGGGVKDRSTKKKELFLKLEKDPKKMWHLSSRGEKGLHWLGQATKKKILFCGFPYTLAVCSVLD